MASGRHIIVKASYDDGANVWFVESSDLPGLSAEAGTLEALAERLPAIIFDLIQENGLGGQYDALDAIPIEIIANISTRVQLRGGA